MLPFEVLGYKLTQDLQGGKLLPENRCLQGIRRMRLCFVLYLTQAAAKKKMKRNKVLTKRLPERWHMLMNLPVLFTQPYFEQYNVCRIWKANFFKEWDLVPPVKETLTILSWTQSFWTIKIVLYQRGRILSRRSWVCVLVIILLKCNKL